MKTIKQLEKEVEELKLKIKNLDDWWRLRFNKEFLPSQKIKLEALKDAAQSFHQDAFYSNSAESGRVGILLEEYIKNYENKINRSVRKRN